MASASVTVGSFGMATPQWPRTKASQSPKLPGSRKNGTCAVVTAPAHVETAKVVTRSPTKIELLRPSEMSAMAKRCPRRNAPVWGGVVWSSAPSLPLQAT